MSNTSDISRQVIALPNDKAPHIISATYIADPHIRTGLLAIPSMLHLIVNVSAIG